jgi:trimethylamine corrinoid protein
MGQQEILENLTAAILEGDNDKAVENAKAALSMGIDPLVAVEQGLSRGMVTIGERFESGDAYLPELLMAADTFNAAMGILKPEIEAQKKSMAKVGTVLLGTVKSDVHNIGKNIVGSILETHGFNVVDLGIDVPSLTFIQKAQQVKADVIALSSLMTTTMPGQKEVIDTLKEMNLRDRYLVVVGGGPVNQQWADRIGADGFGASAVQAVEVIKGLLSRKG